MADAAKKLGCKQSYLSQIETTKTKRRETKTKGTRTDKISPNLAFLIKSMDVYELTPAARLDFLFKVLMDIEKIEVPLKNSSPEVKEKCIALLAVFLLDDRSGKYPQENGGVWSDVKKVWDFLIRSYETAGFDPLA